MNKIETIDFLLEKYRIALKNKDLHKMIKLDRLSQKWYSLPIDKLEPEVFK